MNYEFSCDGDDKCTLKLDDGQEFRGFRDGTLIEFRGIPYAEPPIAERRWKSPVLKTKYEEPVIAEKWSYICATFWAGDDPGLFSTKMFRIRFLTNFQCTERYFIKT